MKSAVSRFWRFVNSFVPSGSSARATPGPTGAISRHPEYSPGSGGEERSVATLAAHALRGDLRQDLIGERGEMPYLEGLQEIMLAARLQALEMVVCRARGSRFAPDSPLEGGVYCELVSEVGLPAPGE
jgi:hypothetical protein